MPNQNSNIKAELNKLIPTFVFYFVASIIVFVLSVLFPDDRHFPGYGTISLVLLPLISAFLFFKNIMKQGSSNNYITAVHLIAILTIILIIYS